MRGSEIIAAGREAGRLLLPVECAGCGAWDVPLCGRCADLLGRRPVRCEQRTPLLAGLGTAPALPTWAVGSYRGALRAILLAWKTHRRQDLAPRLLHEVTTAAWRWAADPDLRRLLAARPVRTMPLVVVPVPSGWRRRLARRLVVADLAHAVAQGLAPGLTPAPAEVLVADLLRRRGGRAHQTALGARGRAANRRGTVRLTAVLPAGTAVLLVDDVVTTGATLAACAETLRSAGARPLGAFVLAATPAPRAAGP